MILEYEGLKLKLHPDVYEPAEDSFLLARKLKVREGDLALDIGTGSGIIALLMARKARFVLGIDVNPKAVELARENARINDIKNVEFRISNLFENVEGKFDIITFNAPYLPGEPEKPIDHALVGGERGREVLDRFIDDARNYLKPKGMVQIVQSSITGIEETLEKLKNKGFNIEITARERYFFEEILVISAQAR